MDRPEHYDDPTDVVGVLGLEFDYRVANYHLHGGSCLSNGAFQLCLRSRASDPERRHRLARTFFHNTNLAFRNDVGVVGDECIRSILGR